MGKSGARVHCVLNRRPATCTAAATASLNEEVDMPLDIPFARHAQGRFANEVARHLQPRGLQPPPSLRRGLEPLTIGNRQHWVLAALALSSAMSMGQVPARSARLPSGNPAPLPGAGAQGGIDHQAVPMLGDAPTAPVVALEHIANGATLGCIASPRHCPQTLAASLLTFGALTASTLGGGALGYAFGRFNAPAAAGRAAHAAAADRPRLRHRCGGLYRPGDPIAAAGTTRRHPSADHADAGRRPPC
jgi:hypothetical protein